MGLYYGYYLCYGTFANQSEATVVEKIPVDASVTHREWKAGVVDIAEINRRGDSWKIKTVPGNNGGVDLFMMEVCDCTMDSPPSSSKRYVLVQRDTKFEYTTTNNKEAGARGSCI